jgi:phospholipid/cholesterol/gamma-HCH transport system substrate-binding protein
VGLGYLSISIGGLRILPRDEYRVSARFSNVGDLKARAPVKVAGVTIGRVQSIRLADYYGEVDLVVPRQVTLPKDTIASIATAGLLGDAYVSLSPGGAETNLRDGDRITHTEPALNMADIIGRTAFGGTSPSTAPTAPASKPVPSQEPPQ